MSVSEGDKTARLPSALCWIALSLFAASLVLPAMRVQAKGEWIAGDLGFHYAFLSLAEFPCWVPHALVIAAPLIARFAGKPTQKASGSMNDRGHRAARAASSISLRLKQKGC
jgi:hypothetical protein